MVQEHTVSAFDQELEDLRRKVQHITEPEADGQPTPEEL